MVRTLLISGLLMVGSSPAWTQSAEPKLDGLFFLKMMAITNQKDMRATLRTIERNWHDSYVPLLLEVGNFAPDKQMRVKTFEMLARKTGKNFEGDLDEWYVWWWKKERPQHPDYANFKGGLFYNLDPSFGRYFNNERTSLIRLDEVRWGGVKRDGIPPLRGPKMIPASEATYLKDKHVVFGIEVNGDVRAYPKRILAWHEMFVDEVGGEPICGVYCTLCGTVIIYKTRHNGVTHQLGTSGFLYRSNKLMYDQATFSLWNTIWGRPVIGPLADQDIELERGYVVTTTWGAWKARHPNSKVLSLDTGYDRDYGEGVAYRDYFKNDRLMFAVPKSDRRLKNKAEVLGLVFPEDSSKTMAIAPRFLKKNPIYRDSLAGVDFIVFTDKSNAARVYKDPGKNFVSFDGFRAKDDTGGVWEVAENQLVSPAGSTYTRLPAHRAFWFGWATAYEDTRLVK